MGQYYGQTQQGMTVTFYTEKQREMQETFETRPLAETMEVAIIEDELNESHTAFISTRDFFFLSTVNGRGEPTVSYKGGDIGTVTVIDNKHLAFPLYDGNGMFLSAGNMDETAKVGLLFIDFETPNRVRVQGNATVDLNDELMASYPGAKMVARVEVTSVFINCARYIHPHKRVATSKYVPDADGQQPYPAWKRIDLLQPALHPDEQGMAEENGGTITEAEYGAKLMAGDS